MGFFDNFKRVRDEEEEGRLIKFRQPKAVQKQITVPKNMRVETKRSTAPVQATPVQASPIRVKADNSSFRNRLDTNMRNEFGTNRDKLKSEMYQNPFKTALRSADTVADTIVPPEPGKVRFRDFVREIPNTGMKATAMMTQDIPKAFVRGAMAMDDQNPIRKGLTKVNPELYKSFSEKRGQKDGNFQYTRDLPLGIGKVNTPRNVYENQRALGNSRTQAKFRESLSTVGIGAELLDFVPGLGQATGAAATGLKVGAPIMGAFMKRAAKVDPRIVEEMAKKGFVHSVPTGKKQSGEVVMEDFVEFVSNKEPSISKMQVAMSSVPNGETKVFRLDEVIDNPDYFRAVAPEDIPDVTIRKTSSGNSLVDEGIYSYGHYDNKNNTHVLFTADEAGTSQRAQAAKLSKTLEHEGTHGGAYKDPLFPPGSNSDIYKNDLANASDEINVPNAMYKSDHGEGIARTKADRFEDGTHGEPFNISYGKTMREAGIPSKQENINFDTLNDAGNRLFDKYKGDGFYAQDAPVKIVEPDAAKGSVAPKLSAETAEIGEYLQAAAKKEMTPEELEQAIQYTEGTATGKVPESVKGAAKRLIELLDDAKRQAKANARYGNKDEYNIEIGDIRDYFPNSGIERTSIANLHINPKTGEIIDKIGPMPEGVDKAKAAKAEAAYYGEDGFKMSRATRPEKEGKTGLFTSGSQELINRKATGVNKLFNAREETIRTVQGKFNAFAKNIFGKTKVTKESFADAVTYLRNGREGAVNETTEKIADGISLYFKRAEEIAREAGIEMGHIDNYFPSMYNTDYLSGGKYVEHSIQHLMDNGFAKTRKEAEDIVKKFTEHSDEMPVDDTGRKQSFERERKITMPDDAYLEDSDILTLYAEKLAKRIGDVTTLGAKSEELTRQINIAEEAGGDRNAIETLVNQHLKRNDWTKGDEVADVATRGVNIVALPFSGIKNAAQIQNTLAHGGMVNTARAIKETVTKEGIAFAKKANAYNEGYMIQDSTENAPWLVEKVAGATMTATEQVLRTTSALTGRGKLHDLVKKAVNGIPKKGTKGYDLLVDDLYQIGLTPEELDNAVKTGITEQLELKSGRAFSDYTQFIINSIETPRKWRTPKGRLLSQYLSFAYKQTGLFRDAVIRAKKGDVKPLVTYITVAPIITLGAAYVTNKAKNAVFEGVKSIGGYDEDVQARPAVPAYKEGDSKLKYGADLASKAYGGVVGLPANAYDKASRSYDVLTNENLTKGQKAVGVAGQISPVAGLAANFASAGLDIGATKEKNATQEEWKDKEDPYKSLKREVVGTIPYAGEELNNSVPALRYNSYKDSLASDVKTEGSGIFGEPDSMEVARVIDGDTAMLANGQRVRFAGIDTPEMSTPRGEAAQSFTANAILGKDVTPVYGADRRGVKGREVIDLMVDGKSVSKMLVEAGLATARSYGANIENAQEFSEAQDRAEAAGKGFWGDGDVKIKLKSEDLGKDPGMIEKFFRRDFGKGRVDFTDSMLTDYKGLSADMAKSKSKELKHKLTDEEIFRIRVAADGYGDYVLGGDNNLSKGFDTGKNPLLDAFKGTKGKSVSKKIAELYADSNYSDTEKEEIYSMMGLTQDDAERSMLHEVKSSQSTGIEEDAKFIYDYMDKVNFSKENIDKLFEEKTLTKGNIEEMYDQGLLTEEQANILGTAQSTLSGKKFKLGSHSYYGDGVKKSSSSSSSSSKKKGTIKMTPYKIPEIKQEKTDYFSDLMKAIPTTGSPNISFKGFPKSPEIDSSFDVPKTEKPAKIKVKFDTGLNR